MAFYFDKGKFAVGEGSNITRANSVWYVVQHANRASQDFTRWTEALFYMEVTQFTQEVVEKDVNGIVPDSYGSFIDVPIANLADSIDAYGGDVYIVQLTIDEADDILAGWTA